MLNVSTFKYFKPWTLHATPFRPFSYISFISEGWKCKIIEMTMSHLNHIPIASWLTIYNETPLWSRFWVLLLRITKLEIIQCKYHIEYLVKHFMVLKLFITGWIVVKYSAIILKWCNFWGLVVYCCSNYGWFVSF